MAKTKKGDPFSIRLTESTDRLVETEARRTRRSKSAVVESFTEEAARMRRFPRIAFRGDDADRRPWLVGTGLDIWQIVESFHQFDSIEEMAAQTDLTEAEVRLALSYRDAYPTEIAEAISENRRPVSELTDLYPFIDVEESV